MKAIVAIVPLLAVALAGCADGPADIDIRHVHGLAYDPVQDALFVATHHGLARGSHDGDWTWRYVGSDRFDYMGFTQDAERPGVFYASGHPDDPHTYGAVHLGLRRSLDSGATWQERSLRGLVDFHALTSLPGAEGWVAGFWQGAIKVSRDGGATWQDDEAPPGTVLALAAAPGQLMAGTDSGLWVARDLDTLGDWTLMGEGLPAVVTSLAAATDGMTMLASAAVGQSVASYRSLDAGASWTKLAVPQLSDQPAPVVFAFDPSDASHAFASTSDGRIMESDDDGSAWTTIRDA